MNAQRSSLQHQERRTLGKNFRPVDRTADLPDLRFQALVGTSSWRKLPRPIQRRFSKKLLPGDTTIYRGQVTETQYTRLGWLLAQAARVIGGPLPLTSGASGPAVVAVTEAPDCGGQTWTRIYARHSQFPQVVHSAKRFCGPTGIEEYVGRGVGMALDVSVENQALVFRSRHYFLELFGRRLRLAHFLSPGLMTITHREEGHGVFSFTLTLDHALAGRLLCQVATFKEMNE